MNAITHKAYARAGLIGNPSDGYNGKTIAFIVRNYCALVTLTASENIEFLAGDNDHNRYQDVYSLRKHVVSHGYYGGIRLMKATVKRFVDYCVSNQIDLNKAKGFSRTYRSDIPQQVGMAGSSAIIIATLRCLMTHYGVDIDKRVQPSLALSVERDELGIGGGLQDRVAQVYEGMVAMDFSRMQQVQGYECGHYTPLSPALLPPVYIAYRPASSEPTEVFHNDLRSRYDAGETKVVEAMQRFAQLTDQAVECLQQRNADKLGKLLDANFDCRQAFCALNPQHVEMIEHARAVGVSAKYAGSGGAIVGTYRDAQQFEELRQTMNQIGCVLIQPVV
ncbi:MAG: GHMP kinase [Pseudomonadota bacterium]